MDRIDESKVSTEEFIEKYEKPYKPVIIQGVQNGWKAQYKWTIEVYLLNYFVSYLENIFNILNIIFF